MIFSDFAAELFLGMGPWIKGTIFTLQQLSKLRLDFDYAIFAEKNFTSLFCMYREIDYAHSSNVIKSHASGHNVIRIDYMLQTLNRL